MNLLDVCLLAVALAMDCFAVSIVSGVIARNGQGERGIAAWIARMAFLFGLFQALMPLLGWLAFSFFHRQTEAYGHWIAFFLLLLIGGNMIRESFSPEEEQHFDPRRLSVQLLLAVATSIDALAVGVSFACTGYERLGSLAVPLSVIGLVSFLFSLFGVALGARFGHQDLFPPERLGGIILILIGLKILLLS